MTDDFDDLVAGIDTVVLCDMPLHESGVHGCFPQQPGSIALEYLHLWQEGHHGERLVVVVCVGHAAWVRARQNQHIQCPTCGLYGVGWDFWKIHGPYERVVGTERYRND